jgi:hypothetical protein
MQGMKYLFNLSKLLLIVLATSGANAQSSLMSPEQTYGLDPLLHNGSFYSYHIPSDTQGTPYFNGPDFVEGTVTLRAITYDHLSLKYDVLNQLLIFQYQTETGGAQHIVLSDAWMEAFSLGKIHFELFALQDTLKQIYQVMGSGSRRILYAWSKERTLDNTTGASHFVFTKLKKKAYLLSHQTIVPYKNNKSWTLLFEEGKQSLIKKHLAQQRINVKTANDQVMTELITYCNSL